MAQPQRQEEPEVKPSEVLRLAAQLIECGAEEYSCAAIKRVLGFPNVSIFSAEFARMPELVAYSELWGRMPLISDFEFAFDGQDPQNLRVLALCMAAAIAEAEGK